MATKYFNDYAKARAFFEAQDGDSSIGSVRKDLQADLGAWVVQYESQAATLTHDGRKLTTTLADGSKATRSTQNAYAAAVVGYNKAGRLVILSAHWDEAAARAAVATFKAGKFVNFNYRDKLVGEPTIITR